MRTAAPLLGSSGVATLGLNARLAVHHVHVAVSAQVRVVLVRALNENVMPWQVAVGEGITNRRVRLDGSRSCMEMAPLV